MSEHTPRPWHVTEGASIFAPPILIAEGASVVAYLDWGKVTDEDRERFALIVKAVNSHDAMLGALKNAESCLRALHDYIPLDCLGPVVRADIRATLSQAIAVISKAEVRTEA